MTLALLSAHDAASMRPPTAAGVLRVQGGRVRSYEVADGMPSDAATTLY